MSNAIARIVFASASLALTCTLFVAQASADVPAETLMPQTAVSYHDLNLADPAGRKKLELRLRIAANSVCADAGLPAQMTACRSVALDQAMLQLQHIVATAS